MPLPATMVAYQVNLECVVEPSPSSSWMEEEDPYVLPTWEVQSSQVHVTERNSYGLGYHNRQLDSRNQSSPICNRNKQSNAKGSNLIPYSGRLK